MYYVVPDEFGFDARILNHDPRRMGKDFHSNPGLAAALQERPAVNYVIGGNYFMPDARRARRHCRKSKSRWFFWGENPFKKAEGGVRRWLKECYLRWFLRGATGVIGIGRAAEEAYRRLSGTRHGINIPYAPDLSALLRPEEALSAKAAEFRSGRVTDDGVLLLYAGSLIERKDPATLIRAFSRLTERFPAVRLLMAGEGPLRADLEAEVKNLKLAGRVEFAGFLQGDELRAAYLAADAFVLPTAGHEGWGVVVQEAMAAGLPVIASSRVGAAADLIGGHDTGMLFDAGNVDQLADGLVRLIDESELRMKMGMTARKLAEANDAKTAARRLVEFLDATE